MCSERCERESWEFPGVFTNKQQGKASMSLRDSEW